MLTLWPAGSESLVKSLIVDGVIGGVGGVLVFLPNIVLLVLAISLLEDSGYMARAAFLMDRVMKSIGLHGKSFIPMLLGFGCSIPAIMATRTIESRRARMTTMMQSGDSRFRGSLLSPQNHREMACGGWEPPPRGPW